MTVGELRALLASAELSDDALVFVDTVDTPRGTLHGSVAAIHEGDVVIRPAPR